MAEGLGRVPVEAEMAAGNRKVGSDGEFFAGIATQQGAVVADAEAQLGRERPSGARADEPDQVKLARLREPGSLRRAWHGLRIGYGPAGGTECGFEAG